eukprot:9501652-Pyramimonas_sp.AAC.1
MSAMKVSLSAPVIRRCGARNLSAKVPNGTWGPKLIRAANSTPLASASMTSFRQASRGGIVSIVGSRKCVGTLWGRANRGVRRLVLAVVDDANAAATEEGGNQKRAQESKEAGIDGK